MADIVLIDQSVDSNGKCNDMFWHQTTQMCLCYWFIKIFYWDVQNCIIKIVREMTNVDIQVTSMFPTEIAIKTSTFDKLK